MKFNVYYTPEFENQLKRLNNCYKIRLAVSSKGKGKSGGARVITCVVISENEIYLADIYDKSEQGNISEHRLKEIVRKINS